MALLALFVATFLSTATGFPGIENKNVKNPNLFEGDMLLTPAQRYAAMLGRDVSKAGLGRASIFKNLWPGGVLPYVLGSDIKRSPRAMNAIRESMKIWETKTCIRFKPRENERNYAQFYVGQGCTSYVGVQGGRQMISLAPGCWRTYITVHEIGHCLGFYHEQSRTDRDNYINIYWNNIQSQYRFAFEKYPRSMIDSLGTPYDYKSIMHYEAYAFSKNRRVTIAAKKPGIVLSNRVGPTDIDIKQMNLLYKCSGGGGGGGGGSSTRPPDTPPPATPPPVTRPPVTRPPVGCVDRDRRCPGWSQYCSSHHYVKRNCQKTCGLCGGGGNCKDYNARCREWAMRGECRKNPRYMLVYCKKSCNHGC